MYKNKSICPRPQIFLRLKGHIYMKKLALVFIKIVYLNFSKKNT